MRTRLTNSCLGLLAVTLLAGLLAVSTGSAAPLARSYAGGAFALELDGVAIGALKSFSGGSAVGQVVESAVGKGGFAKKNIGGVLYEDIALELGLSLRPALYDWLGATVAGNAQRKNGAIVGFDAKMAAASRREFTNAVVSEITLPACDGSSKEPGYLMVKLSAERTQPGATGGKASAPASKDVRWVASQFKLELDGLDTKRVMRVGPIVIKNIGGGDQLGAAREAKRAAGGRIAVSNLQVSLPLASAQDWEKWHEEFVIKGKNGDGDEKKGRLVFLAPNLGDELLELKLFNVGIVALRPAAAGAGDAIAQVEAELYVERVELEVPGAK